MCIRLYLYMEADVLPSVFLKNILTAFFCSLFFFPPLFCLVKEYVVCLELFTVRFIYLYHRLLFNHNVCRGRSCTFHPMLFRACVYAFTRFVPLGSATCHWKFSASSEVCDVFFSCRWVWEKKRKKETIPTLLLLRFCSTLFSFQLKTTL